MPDILGRVQAIFRDVLDKPDLVIDRNSDASNVPDWDSLSHIRIVMAIEEEFDVTFELEQLEQLGHVGDMIDLITAKEVER